MAELALTDLGCLNLFQCLVFNEIKIEIISLKSRIDIVIKSDNKGGAVIVWREKLNIEKSTFKLNNSNFYSANSNDSTISNNSKVKDTDSPNPHP